VTFLRVRMEELPELCDAMGVRKLPTVHVFAGEAGDRIASFTVNLTAKSMARFRRELERAKEASANEVARGGGGEVVGVGGSVDDA
jgi:hypothetical protein